MIDDNKIYALIPSKDAEKKVKALSNPKKWKSIQTNKNIVWGEVKSSSAAFFRTCIDSTTFQSKCNCSVRRKNCNHALGLMLLVAEKEAPISQFEEFPDWVSDWLQVKDEPENHIKSEEALRKAAIARLKNRQKRLQQMSEGIRELERWLADILRQGLAQLQTQPDSFWENISSRLVNAKCGSLAKRVKNWSSYIHQDNWTDVIMEEIGNLYLLLSGFKKIDDLPPDLQQEILTQIGIKIKKDDLKDLPVIEDVWLVVGQEEGKSDDDQLIYRETWLAGESTGKIGQLLEFVWGSNNFETDYRMGEIYRGAVVFYPGAHPTRLQPQQFSRISEPFLIEGQEDFSIFAKNAARAIGENPWLMIYPAVLQAVVPIFEEGQFFLIDRNKKKLPCRIDSKVGWKMVGSSVGIPITVFGKWNFKTFEPISVFVEDQFIILKPYQPVERPKPVWAQFR